MHMHKGDFALGRVTLASKVQALALRVEALVLALRVLALVLRPWL